VKRNLGNYANKKEIAQEAKEYRAERLAQGKEKGRRIKKQKNAAKEAAAKESDEDSKQ